jgi:hypothetical protein
MMENSWSLSSSNVHSETTSTSASMSIVVLDQSTSTCLPESRRQTSRRAMDTFTLSACLSYLNPLDWVLLPPVDTSRVAFNLPFVCSTFASAVQHCGLARELEKGEQLTTFVPVDAAWKQMNFTDLVYLFSPLGRSDLKKILQYHVCAYTLILRSRSERRSTMGKT